jgi:hypothetical protein
MADALPEHKSESKMTAVEYVALAKYAAHDMLADAKRAAYTSENDVTPQRRLYVGGVGEVAVILRRVPHWNVVMSCELTPENTASEDALVRALLASGIEVGIADDGTDETSPTYYARIGDTFSNGFFYDERAAVDALLDALLSAEATS